MTLTKKSENYVISGDHQNVGITGNMTVHTDGSKHIDINCENGIRASYHKDIHNGENFNTQYDNVDGAVNFVQSVFAEIDTILSE